MKSEGIAARPSPARGQREGGSGGGGGTSSPRPRAPNRGRRGEGGCCCLLLEGSDFHRAKDRRNGDGVEENSTGVDSRRARREFRAGKGRGGEPTGPFRASPQQKLTVAATAAAADRNLSPAPRGALRRRGGGRSRAEKSRAAAGGRGGASRNSINKGFASCRSCPGG